MPDKMYEYEMDPTRTVGATEWTRNAGRTDGQADGQTAGRPGWNQYTPPTTSLCGGYNNWLYNRNNRKHHEKLHSSKM